MIINKIIEVGERERKSLLQIHSTNFQKSKSLLLSRVWPFIIPWIIACQAPLSMKFSRQEYWSGLSFPSSGDLPNVGIEPGFPTFQADTLLWATRKAHISYRISLLISKNIILLRLWNCIKFIYIYIIWG